MSFQFFIEQSIDNDNDDDDDDDNNVHQECIDIK